jgi:uncharacterized protein (DUF58 family)
VRWNVRGGSNAVIRVERPLIVPLVIVLGLLAVFGGVAILFVVFYAVAATVLLSYLWTRAIAGGLELSRQPSVGHLQVGSQLEERFVAVNTSILPITYLEIDDHSNFPGYPASKVESLGSRQTKMWRIEWQCRRRGRYHLGPLTIRAGDPFGFFSAQQDYADTISFLVFPPIVDLPGTELPRGAVAGSTSGGAKALQITNTAASIRDYQPGDSYKRIHWPTTARRNQLYVKEYDLERSSDLWIVLDMDRSTLLGEEEESTEEYQVRIAVALANRVLKENRSVGLIASSAEQILIAPDKGGGQLNRILSDLAAVHADGKRPESGRTAAGARRDGRYRHGIAPVRVGAQRAEPGAARPHAGCLPGRSGLLRRDDAGLDHRLRGAPRQYPLSHGEARPPLPGPVASATRQQPATHRRAWLPAGDARPFLTPRTFACSLLGAILPLCGNGADPPRRDGHGTEQRWSASSSIS